MTHATEHLATVVILIVAIIALALAITAFKATARSGNRRLRYVGAAFLVMAAKGILVAYAVQTGAIIHEHLELISSLFDLGVVVLLVFPLLRRP